MQRQRLQQGTLGKRLRQQYAVAGDEPAFFGQRLMTSDKVGGRHAVAVAEEDVIGRSRRQRAIADCGRAEAAVLVPDMIERKRRTIAETLDHFARGFGRAVVRHQQFEVLHRLRLITFERRREGVGPVIGGDDDGGLHGAFSASSISLR